MNKISNKKLRDNGIMLIGKDEEFSQVYRWPDYFISNYGRLLSVKFGKYRIINPLIAGAGYLTYILYKPARKKNGYPVYKYDRNGHIIQNKTQVFAHRLVAQTYIKYNPYKVECGYHIEDLDVHHKDGNRTNNYYKNLMWVSSGRNGTRQDHRFLHRIKKIGKYYPATGRYRTYHDIERLCAQIDIDIIELIDLLKDESTPRTRDGDWTVYEVYEHQIAVQYEVKSKAQAA